MFRTLLWSVVACCLAAFAAATAYAVPIASPDIIGGTPAFGGTSHDDDTWEFGSQRVFDIDNLSGYNTYYACDGTGTGVGTFLEFDFGYAATIGGLSHINNSEIDGITQSKLIFSDDAVFDGSDTVLTLDHITSAENSSNEFRFDPVSAQYVRWEVTAVSGGGNLQGSRYLRFHDDQEVGRLSMAMIDKISEYNSTKYHAVHAYDGMLWGGASTQWASLHGAADTYIDFDFGSVQDIGGVEAWQRENDFITAADLVFSNTPDFSTVVATKSVTFDAGNFAHTSILLDETVSARYVRVGATAFEGGGDNAGLSNIYFTEPGTPPFETNTSTFTFAQPVMELATSEHSRYMRYRLIAPAGLSEDTPDGLHAAAPGSDNMWHAGSISAGIVGGESASGPPVVAEQELLYDLGYSVDLDSVLLWNINQIDLTGRGVKDFELFVSTDPDLATWTSLGTHTLAEAAGDFGEPAQTFAVNQAGVHGIKIDILAAHSGEVNEYVGLSKVRFVPNSIPESDSNVIRPVAAFATTAYGNHVPELLIDGSGFCYPDLELADARHGVSRGAHESWHASNAVAVAEQELTFDLGANYDLEGALVWQIAQYLEGELDLTGRGIDEFDIYLSTDDNQETWDFYSTEYLTKALGTVSEAAQEISIVASGIRMVKFDIKSCHSGEEFEYVGLGEVRFLLGEGGPALPGDLNGDGAVNSGDLDLVRGNWGVSGGTPGGPGDANEDGNVNSADLDIVRANWGTTAAAAVPEPGAISLLLLGTLAMLLHRRQER